MTQPDAEQLKKLHSLQKKLLDKLLELDLVLDEEYKVLSKRDLEGLKNCTSKKQSILSEIFELSNDKAPLYNQLQIKPSKEDFLAFLEGLPQQIGTILLQQHHELEQKLTSAKLKSEKNEQITTRNNQNISQLIAILQGQQNRDKIYDTSGSSGHYRAQTRLGKA